MRENELTRARKRLREAILADLRAGDTFMDICIRHGVSMPTVSRVAKANGIVRRPRKEAESRSGMESSRVDVDNSSGDMEATQC